MKRESERKIEREREISGHFITSLEGDEGDERRVGRMWSRGRGLSGRSSSLFNLVAASSEATGDLVSCSVKEPGEKKATGLPALISAELL